MSVETIIVAIRAEIPDIVIDHNVDYGHGTAVTNPATGERYILDGMLMNNARIEHVPGIIACLNGKGRSAIVNLRSVP